jgi:DNA-binding NarL/FixJ family response regulator
VLIVDDHEPWLRFVSAAINAEPEWRVIGEACDGLKAVHMAQQLRPDLVMLDIGLPKLNGLEAAVRILEVSPASKILFVSENRSRDIAEHALSTGGSGYVVKSDASSDLVPAIRTVLAGRRFISASLAGQLLATTLTLSASTIQFSWILSLVTGMG